jgi:hypothetical protein
VSDILTIAAVIAGFAFVIVAIAMLGAGSHDSLADMLVSPTMPARPRGVQESDLPRFNFRDIDRLGTSAA